MASDFGTQICQTDTIWNFGDADVKVTSITIDGANAGEFVVTPIPLPLIIHAKSHQAIQVCAIPMARGLREAELFVDATSAERALQASIALAVFGQEVCASFSPDNTQPLFAEQRILKNSDSTLCIEVTNCGDVATAFVAHLTDATHYKVTPVHSVVVQPGQVTDFCIHFNPTATGRQDSKLIIAGEHLGDVVVDLQGVGACANLTNREYTVPATNAGGHSSFTVTIDNTGNYDYTLGTPSRIVAMSFCEPRS